MGMFTLTTEKPGSITLCESMRTWLEAMVEHVGKNPGCRLERCDNAKQRFLAMKDSETNAEFTLGLTRATDRSLWEIDLPQHFVDLLRTPDSRDRLAHILSAGDHCLDFSKGSPNDIGYSRERIIG